MACVFSSEEQLCYLCIQWLESLQQIQLDEILCLLMYIADGCSCTSLIIMLLHWLASTRGVTCIREVSVGQDLDSLYILHLTIYPNTDYLLEY